MKNYKKLMLGALCLALVALMAACGKKETNDNNSQSSNVQTEEKEEQRDTKEEQTQETEEKEDSTDEFTLTAEQEKVVKSLIKSPWKPDTGTKSNADGMIDEVPATDIYGRNAYVGGIYFTKEGKFEKLIGIYSDEDVDRGSYTIDTEKNIINFTVESGFNKGNAYEVEYEANDGEVLYFVIPASEETEGYNVRFNPGEEN